MIVVLEVKVRVILLDPSNNIYVVGTEACFVGLGKVTWSKGKDEGDYQAEPKVGRCSKEVVKAI